MLSTLMIIPLLAAGATPPAPPATSPEISVDVTITRGKLSSAREKPEQVHLLARVAPGREPDVEDGFTGSIAISSNQGIQTVFVDMKMCLRLKLLPTEGGTRLEVTVTDNFPVKIPPPRYSPLPVRAPFAVRKREIKTTLGGPFKAGDVIDLGGWDDPYADRTWSASLRIVDVAGVVKGAAAGPIQNTLSVARIDELDGNQIRTSVLRVTHALDASATVENGYSIPIPVVSQAGAEPVFVDYKVLLQLSPPKGAEAGGRWTAHVTANRPNLDKDGAPVVESVHKKELLGYVALGPAEESLGSIADGDSRPRITARLASRPLGRLDGK